MLVGTEPGEGQQVFLFVALSFFQGIANNFIQTAAFTLFLSRYSAQTLSYVYILNAVVVTGLTALYLRLGRRLAFHRLLIANLSFLLVLTVVFWISLVGFHAVWAVFLLPVLFQITINFGIMAYWPLANRLFTVRQGKRLFSVIGSGQWIAIVATGFLMGPLSASIGTQNLLGPGLIGLVGMLGVMWVINQKYRSGMTGAEDQAGKPEVQAKVERQPPPWQERYILLIFSLVAVWWVVFFLLDNLFYDRASARYPDPTQLAGFLGFFLSGLGFLTLVMNFFLAGRILSKYGMRTSLLILPSLLSLATLVLAVSGSIGASALVFFWMAIAAKVLDVILGFSLDRSMQSLLYQPFPADRRGQIQTIAEGAVQPFGNGLAGVILLALGAVFQPVTQPLIVTLVVLCLAWVAIAYALGREYPRRLAEAIRKRRLEFSTINLADPATVQILRQGLNNPHPGPVIYAANSLEETNPQDLALALPELLRHPSPDVRQNTYERIERLKPEAILPQLRAALKFETYPLPRRAAIRALFSFGKAEDLAKDVDYYINHPMPDVRLGAIVGMIRGGGIEGILLAGSRLLELAHSAEVEERVQACQAIGEIGIQQYYQPLLALLQDPEPRVRQAALRAAGQLKSPALWPQVIAAVDDVHASGAAISALAAGGEAVLPLIQAALEDVNTHPVARRRLIAACGQMKSQGALDLLCSHLQTRDLETRSALLLGLNRMGYTAQGAEQSRLAGMIRQEAGFSAWLIAARLDLEGNEACRLVYAALQAELENSRERIFAMLGCLGNRRVLWQAQQAINHPSSDQRAYALEIIDTHLPQEFKPALIPLLDQAEPEQRLKRLGGQFPQRRLNVEERLGELAGRPLEWNTAWLAATALYAASRLNSSRAGQTAERIREIENALVLDSHGTMKVQGEAGETFGGGILFSIIEKVLILKKTGLFSETPDSILAEVAQTLDEINYSEGRTIFEKGSPGSSMYLIASGKVRVFEGARTLNYLEEGGVFGEMAVLDPAPRSASVEAVADTCLLKMEQAQLYELVESRLEVARGIIQVLSRHLRNRLSDIDRLQNVLEQPMRG
ncbi:MAG TPA: Npt1/Npt2 family nucleotide transporter [Anaerolineaceae bacterium]|nr:Npt1/Npt2 family nucleotide transporter [Anaerolineaceae bacterium]